MTHPPLHPQLNYYFKKVRYALAELEQVVANLHYESESSQSVEDAPVPPAGKEHEWYRWWALLDEIEQAGGRVPRSRLHDLARRYYDDLRGLGGFFGGQSATLRYDGDTACLTDQGRAMVVKWSPTFRQIKEDGRESA